jgi:hypothetical protein
MAFFNFEGWLVDILTARLGVPVATGAPSSPPAKFLVARRTGGPAMLRVTERPMFVLESYARFEDDAVDLLNQAREALFDMAHHRTEGPVGIVYRVTEFGGPGNLPDPLLPTFSRYSATLEMRLRAR